MTATPTVPLDPAALAAFAGSLANLPAEEIRKAKKLYILNAIEVWKDDLGADHLELLRQVGE